MKKHFKILAVLILTVLILNIMLLLNFYHERNVAISNNDFIKTFETQKPISTYIDDSDGYKTEYFIYNNGKVIITKLPDYTETIFRDENTSVMKVYINNVLYSVFDFEKFNKFIDLRSLIPFNKKISGKGWEKSIRSLQECIHISTLLKQNNYNEVKNKYNGIIFQSKKGTYFVD